MDNKLTVNLKKQKIKITIDITAKLTDTEILILEKLLSGKAPIDIAHERNRSLKTISYQKMKIYKKLGVKNDFTLWPDIFFQFEHKITKQSSTDS